MILYIEYLLSEFISSTPVRCNCLNKKIDLTRAGTGLRQSFSAFQKNTALLYLVPLVLLSGNLLYLIFADKIESVCGYYLIHYFYDYSRGYLARGLVGEILKRLFYTISDEITYGVMIVSDFLLVISSSLCMGKALSKVKNDDYRFRCVLFLCFLLCIFPFTFRLYHIDFKLDKFLWFLTLFAVFLADNKIGILFTPLFCVAATMVNPVFLFCSMILISIILLQKFHDSRYSVKNGIICFVAYAAMIFIGIYGAANEKNLGFENSDELTSYYFSRYSSAMPDYFLDKFETEWLLEFFLPVKECFKKAFEIYFKDWGYSSIVILSTLFLAVPVFALLSKFWIDAIKAEKNGFQKFIFALCLISPVVLILPIILSWEASKYYANNIIVQLCLIIYYIANNNQSVMTAAGKMKARVKNHFFLSSAAMLYYTLLIK